MTNDNNFSNLKLNEVVIMEDDLPTQKTMDNILKELGCKVRVAKDSEQVINFAKKQNAQVYILDINMGEGRGQEGLDALERLKKIDNKFFVAALTAYPKRFKDMALRLKADHFQEKSSDTSVDIRIILDKLLANASNRIRQIKQTLIESAPSFEQDPSYEPEITDPNLTALQTLLADNKWRKANLGCYVAIVKGKLVGVNKNKEELLVEIRSQYPDEPRYFAQVEEMDTIIDLPSPLAVDET